MSDEPLASQDYSVSDSDTMDDGPSVQVIKAEGGSTISNVTQIGKIVVQFVVEQISKRFGLEVRVGFIVVGILIIGSAVALYLALRPRPSARMIGDFRIAVADFVQQGNSEDSEIGTELAQSVYLRLEQTFEEMDLGFTVTIWGPEQVVSIKGQDRDQRASSAERIGEAIGADIVVYGVVDTTSLVWQVLPEFYVSLKNFYEAQEIVGQHEIGTPFPISGQGSIADRIGVSSELASRVEALSYLTVGLSYYAVQDYDRALTYFQTAEIVLGWDDSEGKEIMYLLAGNVAGRNGDLEMADQYYTRAQAINPRYARVYVGLGNVYYVQAFDAYAEDVTETALTYLEESLDYYQQALSAPFQPAQSDIDAKAHFGLGSAYLLQAIIHEADMSQAAQEFDRVIASYDESQAERLRERAAAAHASLGLIYRLSAEDTLAVAEYKQAITLIEDIPQLQGKLATYYAALGDEYVDAGRLGDAVNAYQHAVQLAVSSEATADYRDRLEHVQAQMEEP